MAQQQSGGSKQRRWWKTKRGNKLLRALITASGVIIAAAVGIPVAVIYASSAHPTSAPNLTTSPSQTNSSGARPSGRTAISTAQSLPPRATFNPGPAAIVPGSDLTMSGTAQNLGAGSLWLVDKPDKGNGYFLPQNAPLTVIDGKWTYTDTQVGDSTDVHYHIVYYLYLSTNKSCSQFLASAPSDGDTPVPSIDQSCGQPLGQPLVVAIK